MVRRLCQRHAKKHTKDVEVQQQVKSPFPHDGSPGDVLSDYAYSRVDKNEHTLAAAPRLGYMIALHEAFLMDTATFRKTNLTPKKAA